MQNEEIIFLIKVMNGGGAERVISLLANHFVVKGYNVSLLITHQKLKQADLRRLDNSVHVMTLEDELTTSCYDSPWQLIWARFIAKLACLLTSSQDKALIEKYKARNYAKVKWLKEYFRQYKNATLVAFLYDAIFLTLLAKKSSNRLIISERGDPCQSLDSKTDMAFFRTMFSKADAMVFQSPDVQRWYKENIGIEGTMIFNPVTNNLPKPYMGIRNKRIVNFCRISPQKNLIVLIEAFERLYLDYPDYELWIYGDPDSSNPDYAKTITEKITSSCCQEDIHLHASIEKIHSEILDCAMFVSSSDYEGMSNSMLEAMAIGLPVICTDCPAGGARAIIKDHENGLLVPVKDPYRLYLAMKEVIEKPDLAMRLSTSAIKIRETQSEEIIMKEWESLLAQTAENKLCTKSAS